MVGVPKAEPKACPAPAEADKPTRGLSFLETAHAAAGLKRRRLLQAAAGLPLGFALPAAPVAAAPSTPQRAAEAA